jgi:hypothetical protein
VPATLLAYLDFVHLGPAPAHKLFGHFDQISSFLSKLFLVKFDGLFHCCIV